MLSDSLVERSGGSGMCGISLGLMMLATEGGGTQRPVDV